MCFQGACLVQSTFVNICQIVNVPVKQVALLIHFIWLYICMIEKSKYVNTSNVSLG